MHRCRRMHFKGEGSDSTAVFAIAPSVSEPPYSVSESVDVSEESSVGLEGDVGAVLVMDLVSSKTVVGAVRLLVRRFQPFPRPLPPFA